MAIAGAMAAAARVFDPYPEFDNVRVFKGRPETGGRQFYKSGGLIVPRYELLPGVLVQGGAGFGQREINGAWRGARDGEPLIGDGGLRGAEGRTNSIRNPVMAGSGGFKGGGGTINGSVPNAFIVNAASGVTANLSYATIDGQTFLIAEVSGTPATSAHFEVFFTDAVSTPAASNGQTWTVQAGVALLAGSLSSVSAATLRGSMFDTGFLGSVTSPDLKASISASVSTLRAQLVVNQAATQYFRPQIAFSGSGSPVSYTVAIGLPNLKLGPDINDPPILQTSGLAATRTAMAYRESGRNIAPVHYGVARARWLALPQSHVASFQHLVELRAASGSARVLWLGAQVAGNQNFNVLNDADIGPYLPLASPAVGQWKTIAWAARANQLAISEDGAAVATGALSGPISSAPLTRLSFAGGAASSGSAIANAELDFFATADGEISNDNLQALAARFAA